MLRPPSSIWLAMMQREGGHVIVDVRRQDEYDAGHIPGAILIPNESIGGTQPEALPDLDQEILIYCRSGNRSKQAAQKLFDIGYTRSYAFDRKIGMGGLSGMSKRLHLSRHTNTAIGGSFRRLHQSQRSTLYRLPSTPRRYSSSASRSA